MGCNTSKSADLTDEDVQFLMKNTSYTEKEIRDWYKGFQVDCPDGKLSRDKFIEIYKVFFKGGNPEKFCQHVYRTFDEDGNGSSKSHWQRKLLKCVCDLNICFPNLLPPVDFKEFLMAIGITTSQNPREKLKWAFKMYDINNDGLIELDEMTKIIKVIFVFANLRPLGTLIHFQSRRCTRCWARRRPARLRARRRRCASRTFSRRWTPTTTARYRWKSFSRCATSTMDLPSYYRSPVTCNVAVAMSFQPCSFITFHVSI